MLRAKFGYETRKIKWIALFLFIVDALSIGLMVMVMDEEPGMELFALGFSAFMIAIALLFGVSPLLTKHEVHDTYIVLRQGWYYRNRIDLSDIEKVSLVKNGPFTIGYHYIDGHTGIVNGRTKDLIMMEMRGQKNYNGKKRRITRILFDTNDNEAFLNAIGRSHDVSTLERL